MVTINVDSTTLPTQLPAYQRQMLTAKLLIMHRRFRSRSGLQNNSEIILKLI